MAQTNIKRESEVQPEMAVLYLIINRLKNLESHANYLCYIKSRSPHNYKEWVEAETLYEETLADLIAYKRQVGLSKCII